MPTCYRLDLVRLFTPCKEDDILLRGFRVSILEYEELVDTIFL